MSVVIPLPGSFGLPGRFSAESSLRGMTDDRTSSQRKIIDSTLGTSVYNEISRIENMVGIPAIFDGAHQL